LGAGDDRLCWSTIAGLLLIAKVGVVNGLRTASAGTIAKAVTSARARA